MSEEANLCDTCEGLWEVLFEWDYTEPERYCREHLLTPLEGQPGKTLLDFFPDCQQITHRPMPLLKPNLHVRHHSTAMLRVVLTGKLYA